MEISKTLQKDEQAKLEDRLVELFSESQLIQVRNGLIKYLDSQYPLWHTLKTNLAGYILNAASREGIRTSRINGRVMQRIKADIPLRNNVIDGLQREELAIETNEGIRTLTQRGQLRPISEDLHIDYAAVLGRNLEIKAEELRELFDANGEPKRIDTPLRTALVDSGYWKAEYWDFALNAISKAIYRRGSELILFLHAPSRSLKSTFLDAIRAAVGESYHAGVMNGRDFTSRSFIAADFVDKGIVTFDEDITSNVLNDLLSYSGSNSLRCERKFCDAYTAKFKGLILLADTSIPPLTTLKGFDRRLVVIPMLNAKHGEAGSNDTEYRNNLIYGSREGLILEILQKEIMQQALEIPEELVTNTKERLAESDVYLSWIADNLVQVDSNILRAEAFNRFIKDERLEGKNKRNLANNFTKTLARLGYETEGNGRYQKILNAGFRDIRDGTL